MPIHYVSGVLTSVLCVVASFADGIQQQVRGRPETSAFSKYLGGGLL